MAQRSEVDGFEAHGPRDAGDFRLGFDVITRERNRDRAPGNCGIGNDMKTNGVERLDDARPWLQGLDVLGSRGVDRKLHEFVWTDAQRIYRIDDDPAGEIQSAQRRIGRRPGQRQDHDVGATRRLGRGNCLRPGSGAGDQRPDIGAAGFARAIHDLVAEPRNF